MIKLSEEIRNFIYFNINDLTVPNMFLAFDMFDKFSLPFYEDKYFNIIYSEDDIEPMDIPVIFTETVCRDMETIIKSHAISLIDDPAPTFDTLLKLCQGLYTLQNLEDFYIVERIMSTNNPNEFKLAQIIQTYTELDMILSLECLELVSDTFFEQLQELIDVRRNELTDESGKDPKRVITATFFKYLGEQDTLGGRLFNQGFDKPIEFNDLIAILPMNVKNYIAEQLRQGPAYAAINILSLLMVCSDTREQPVTAYKEVSELLLDSPETITAIYNILVNMHNGFMIHYKEFIKDSINENDISVRLS